MFEVNKKITVGSRSSKLARKQVEIFEKLFKGKEKDILLKKKFIKTTGDKILDRNLYEIGNKMDPEKIEIAKFWDCNPYVTHHRGHAMFATKKITPGGHWIGITAIAGRTANSSFDEAVNAYANVSISLFDSFISCWDEKWRSILVRPETLINQHYDEEWLPLLQTPPFQILVFQI